MATMAEIAREVGVSQGVVSCVVNKDQTLRISKETRARVESKIVELGYSPNVVAQSLASSRSGAIAVVVHDIANPVYGEILRGASKRPPGREWLCSWAMPLPGPKATHDWRG